METALSAGLRRAPPALPRGDSPRYKMPERISDDPALREGEPLPSLR